MSIIFSKKLFALAAQTPSSRDRYVDFLRALSIVVVVLGHWLSSVIVQDGQVIRAYNAVGVIPGMWLSTWILQVMPLFFFVGGFSNMITYDSYRHKGLSSFSFYRSRLTRLFRPTFAFLFILSLTYTVLIGIIPDWPRFVRIGIIIIQPLWFLGVYLFMVLLTPFMRKVHRRLGIIAPAALLLLAVSVDVISFGTGIFSIRWINIAFVWLFVHQLGFFYADGTMSKLPRWIFALVAGIGLTFMIALTNIGVYPRSMVGTGLERVSNMNPPTVCIAALSLWLVGLAMFLRKPAAQWLQRTRPWMIVILANSMIMTLYLWHLVAFAITYVILHSLGFGADPAYPARFWIERPAWILTPAVILAMVVTAFRRFEKTAG